MPGATTGERGTRVLHVAESICGGVASFLDELALDQNRTLGSPNVHFVVPAEHQSQLTNVAAEQLSTFVGKTRSVSALIDFTRVARRAIRRFRPEILHLHSSFAGAVVRGMRKTETVGARMIYCPHGWAFAMDISQTRKRIYATIERQLAHGTDLIINNSQNEYEIAARLGLPTGRMVVIRNGIAWAPPLKKVARTDILRLAFIGRNVRQKGLDLLVNTIRKFPLPGIHFHVAGDCAPEDKMSIPANVTFHGWLTRSETLQLLTKMDAVVMPSRWDAAPIAALEAMRAGLPLIASNRGGLPEIVGHEIGGYIFDLEDDDALGQLLQSLNRANLERLGRGARIRWESHYRAELMSQRTREAYQRVLNSKPEAAHMRPAPAPANVSRTAATYD